MKGGRSDVLKPDRLGLSCKANKCSDAGTGDLPTQPDPDECHLKYK